MSLTAKDRQLLRDVFRWARAEGFRREHTRDFEGRVVVRLPDWASWTHPSKLTALQLDHDDQPTSVLHIQRENGWLDMWVSSVREAVDILAALGILPITFSSAYKAGAESALDRDEWRVRIAGYDAPWSENNYSREDAETSLGRALQHYPDAWIEHRHTGATKWERVVK